jgi:hypothetical protein
MSLAELKLRNSKLPLRILRLPPIQAQKNWNLEYTCKESKNKLVYFFGNRVYFDAE